MTPAPISGVMRAGIILSFVLFALLGAYVEGVDRRGSLANPAPATVVVDAYAPIDVPGKTYRSVQPALDYMANTIGDYDWTIELREGTYGSFRVPEGIGHLSITGESRADTVLTVDEGPITLGGEELALRNVTLLAPEDSAEESAVVRATASGEGGHVLLDECSLVGNGAGSGLELDAPGVSVTNCSFALFDRAIAASTDARLATGEVSGNVFTDCDYAIDMRPASLAQPHGDGADVGGVQEQMAAAADSPGDSGHAADGVLYLRNNVITGTDERLAKVAVQDASRAGVTLELEGNTLYNAVVGLAGTRDLVGESAEQVVADNELCSNSFWVQVAGLDATDPDSFVASFTTAPGCHGEWVLSEDDGTLGDRYNAVFALVERTNAHGAQTGDYTINLAELEDSNMTRFVLLEGGLSWRGDAAPEPVSITPQVDAVATQTDVLASAAAQGEGDAPAEFELRDALGQLVATAVADDAGRVRFEELGFSRRGVYVYSISRAGLDGGGKGASAAADDSVVTLTVDVTYDCDANALRAEATYTGRLAW